MRGLTISAFVLDGVAAVGFIAMMAFGDGRMTPLDGFVLSALLLGFFSALGSILITAPGPRVAVRVPFPERRRLERRVLNLGGPDGIERRLGLDRRALDASFEALLQSRPLTADLRPDLP